MVALVDLKIKVLGIKISRGACSIASPKPSCRSVIIRSNVNNYKIVSKLTLIWSSNPMKYNDYVVST